MEKIGNRIDPDGCWINPHLADRSATYRINPMGHRDHRQSLRDQSDVLDVSIKMLDQSGWINPT